MTELPPPAPSTVPRPPVPRVLWAFAATFLLETVVQLVVRGPKSDTVSLVGSVLLGVVVVPFFAVGVVRAGRVRTALAGLLLALTVVLGLLGLVVEPSVGGLATTVVAAVQGVLLSLYTGTTWWDWQRTQPTGGPSPVPILSVAVAVGVLGGIAAPPTGPGTANVTFHVSF